MAMIKQYLWHMNLNIAGKMALLHGRMAPWKTPPPSPIPSKNGPQNGLHSHGVPLLFTQNGLHFYGSPLLFT